MKMLEDFLKSLTLIEYRRQQLDRITELYFSIYFFHDKSQSCHRKTLSIS